MRKKVFLSLVLVFSLAPTMLWSADPEPANASIKEKVGDIKDGVKELGGKVGDVAKESQKVVKKSWDKITTEADKVDKTIDDLQDKTDSNWKKFKVGFKKKVQDVKEGFSALIAKIKE